MEIFYTIAYWLTRPQFWGGVVVVGLVGYLGYYWATH